MRPNRMSAAMIQWRNRDPPEYAARPLFNGLQAS
jgi:hypothetical protein